MKARKTVSVSALAVAVLLSATSCGKKEQQPQTEAPVSVKEMTVGQSAAASDYNYSGTVEEESGTQLSFLTGGTITSIRVKVGDRVQKGQLVATVDPTSIKNSHAMAVATLQQAQDAYNRLKQLHDRGSLPDIKWVEAESQLSQATAAEKIARKSLADCNLYAPTSGVVAEKLAEVGQNAAPGLPVVKLVTTQVMNVRVAVPEQEVARLSVGQRAQVLVPSLADRVFEGRIVEKGVVADPLSRTYSVKIRVEGAARDLLPGMVTKVNISEERRVKSEEGRVKSEEFNSSSKLENSSLSTLHSSLQKNSSLSTLHSSLIVIPSRLLQLGDDNEYFVWIDNGGKAERRTVKCGAFTASGVVIESGLQSGDKVITEGQQKVCNGTSVRP